MIVRLLNMGDVPGLFWPGIFLLSKKNAKPVTIPNTRGIKGKTTSMPTVVGEGWCVQRWV